MSDSVRKLVLCNTYYHPHSGGVEKVLESLAVASLKLGYNPIILCTNLDLNRLPTLKHLENSNGIRIIRFRVGRPRYVTLIAYYFKMIVKYRWYIKRLGLTKNDMIICRSHLSAFGATLLQKPLKTQIIYSPPCIVSFDELKTLGENEMNQSKLSVVKKVSGKIKNRIDDIIQKKALSKAGYNVVASKLFLDELVHKFSSDGKRGYHHIPFGVDTVKFGYKSKNLGCNKKYFDIGAQRVKKFVFLGRLIPSKGLDYAIESFKLLGTDKFIFDIIGDGPMMESLKEKVRIMGLTKSIKFLGQIDSPEKFLPQYDVFIFPSLWESFGNVVLEAMASGLPILGFKSQPPQTVLPTNELIKDGTTGWLVEPNIKAYSSLVSKIINMPNDELSSVKKATRDFCVSKYAWETYIGNLEKLYFKNNI